MPEFLTLIFVAGLGLVVGAVGVGAFRFSQHEIDEKSTVDAEESDLCAETLAVLTSLPSISLVVDSDLYVLRADAAAYAKGIVRGKLLVHQQVKELIDDIKVSGMPVTADLELPRSTVERSNMLVFHVRVSALPKGRFLILVEDHTMQRRNEASRRDFSANVSHELKTPVGAIHLLAETIADNADEAEVVRRFAPKLLGEAERLSALVKDIIDLSRLEAPDPLGTPELVDMDEVVSIAMEREWTTAASSRIELVGPSRDSGAKVWGNLDMLVTAVRNLLDNAVRYSSPGDRVNIGLTDQDDVISVSVVDSGIGIDEEDQQRIFERFYRVDPARSRNTGGTGLGLSIVKHIASDHGGTVTVWSKPNRGSTFTLMLPRADVGHAPDSFEQISHDIGRDEYPDFPQ